VPAVDGPVSSNRLERQARAWRILTRTSLGITGIAAFVVFMAAMVAQFDTASLTAVDGDPPWSQPQCQVQLRELGDPSYDCQYDYGWTLPDGRATITTDLVQGAHQRWSKVTLLVSVLGCGGTATADWQARLGGVVVANGTAGWKFEDMSFPIGSGDPIAFTATRTDQGHCAATLVVRPSVSHPLL
jgi:hypothetical protein